MPTKTKVKQLPPLLTEENYPYPDDVYEFYTETTTMNRVRREDVVSIGGIDYTVARTKSGTKWTELWNRNDDKIARRENLETISVTRHRRTEACRKADARAGHNRSILKNVLPDIGKQDDDPYWVQPVLKELNDCIDQVNRGFLLQSSYITSILEAQAKAKVRAQFLEAVEWAASGDKKIGRTDEPWTGDLVDVLDEFIDFLKDRIISLQSSFCLSRSTSVIENALTDADMWAIKTFIQDSEYWR